MSAVTVGKDPRAIPRWMWLIVLTLVALSAVGWTRLRVDTSLEPLLPEHSDALQTVLFLKDSSFAAKAILWFRLTGDGTLGDLYKAEDATIARLDPALVKGVAQPPDPASAMASVFALLDHADELLTEKDLADMAAAAEPDTLKQIMQQYLLELQRPEGSFAQQVLQRDPLAVSNRILLRLKQIKDGMGFKVDIKDGRLVNNDGRQLMLVLETTGTATSLASSQALVNHLNALAAAAPPGVSITPICGQIHTVENSRLMQRDLRIAGILNALTFVLLFLFVSRDWRVGAVFLLPVISIGLTIGLCAVLHPSLSAIVIGISLSMAGGAVDYGIFVYTAVQSGGDPVLTMRRIRKPLIISHLTTLGVFIAFLFSAIPAYRQLGWLTSISLILSLLAALFLLPSVLTARGRIALLGRGPSLVGWARATWPVACAFALLIVFAIASARHVKFNPDLGRIDGTPRVILSQEQAFQASWSNNTGDTAIVVAQASTREAADELNDQIAQRLGDHVADGAFASLANFWPSGKTRADNIARWQAFWTPDRIAKTKAAVAVAGEPFGFSTDAFDPFWRTVQSPPPISEPPEIFGLLQEQFVARAGGDWQLLSFCADTEANIALLKKTLGDLPGVQIVSKRALGQAFADSARSESLTLGSIATVFIIGALLLLTRSVSKSIIILLPVVAGVAIMLATLTVMGLSMSVISVVAGIVVVGLTGDYGVFSAYAWDNRETLLGQSMASMHLCAITTVVGAAALLFAQHPALYLVGVSLVSGLAGGYLTALVVVPSLCWVMARRRDG